MPWVAGCEGPIEIVCVSKWPARSSVSLRPLRHAEVFLGEEPALARRVVLAQRVADERVVAEDAVQVRVPGEFEAVEVERLPLEPVGGRPDVDDARQRRLLRVRERDAHADVLVARQRVEVDDRLEPGRRPRAPEVVDAAEVEEEVEAAAGIVAEEARERRPVVRRRPRSSGRSRSTTSARPATGDAADPLAQRARPRDESAASAATRHEVCSAAQPARSGRRATSRPRRSSSAAP